MIADGAEIIDVGGETTRPGAEPVDEREELRRVLPVIERLAKREGHGEQFVITVDTMKPAVARAAVDAGASIINDVTGLRDAGMIETAKAGGAGVVVMHMQGEPTNDAGRAALRGRVRRSPGILLPRALQRCLASGVPATHIASTPESALAKPASTISPSFAARGRTSRPPDARWSSASRARAFIGKVLGLSAPEDRAWPTVALTSHGRERGARIFRVHDVKPNVEALRMTEAILGGMILAGSSRKLRPSTGRTRSRSSSSRSAFTTPTSAFAARAACACSPASARSCSALVLLSQLFGLEVISWLLQRISAVVIVALVVIFQPELRRVLAQLGSHRFFGIPPENKEIVEELAETTFDLSNKQLGALIAIERGTDIQSHIESGVLIDCRLSPELVVTIFHPKTPLHDGGIIVAERPHHHRGLHLPREPAGGSRPQSRPAPSRGHRPHRGKRRHRPRRERGDRHGLALPPRESSSENSRPRACAHGLPNYS